MTDYTMVPRVPYDLANITTCIPSEEFIQLMPMLVFKTDAIKLGAVCFIAGMILMLIYIEIDKRWKK